jgi:hypothetical protein
MGGNCRGKTKLGCYKNFRREVNRKKIEERYDMTGLGIKPRKVSERCPDALHEPHSNGWADDRATAKTTIPRQKIRRLWHIGGVCSSNFSPHRNTERNDDI